MRINYLILQPPQPPQLRPHPLSQLHPPSSPPSSFLSSFSFLVPPPSSSSPTTQEIQQQPHQQQQQQPPSHLPPPSTHDQSSNANVAGRKRKKLSSSLTKEHSHLFGSFRCIQYTPAKYRFYSQSFETFHHRKNNNTSSSASSKGEIQHPQHNTLNNNNVTTTSSSSSKGEAQHPQHNTHNNCNTHNSTSLPSKEKGEGNERGECILCQSCKCCHGNGDLSEFGDLKESPGPEIRQLKKRRRISTNRLQGSEISGAEPRGAFQKTFLLHTE